MKVASKGRLCEEISVVVKYKSIRTALFGKGMEKRLRENLGKSELKNLSPLFFSKKEGFEPFSQVISGLRAVLFQKGECGLVNLFFLLFPPHTLMCCVLLCDFQRS